MDRDALLAELHRKVQFLSRVRPALWNQFVIWLQTDPDEVRITTRATLVAWALTHDLGAVAAEARARKVPPMHLLCWGLSESGSGFSIVNPLTDDTADVATTKKEPTP